MAYFKLETRGHVAILTIDRPEVLNALDHYVYVEWNAMLDEIEADDNIYVLIFTGAGRAFLAGGTIVQMRATTSFENQIGGLEASLLSRRLEYFKKPVIAAVNGYALGGGSEIALACDICLASEKARFGFPETGLGIIAGDGCTQLLTRAVGPAVATELTATGRTVKPDEALKLGLISHIYPPEELMPKAIELAEVICSNAQIAVQQSKMAIRTGLEVNIEAGCKLEVEANAVCFATEDKHEGMTAFLEKRAEKHFKYR